MDVATGARLEEPQDTPEADEAETRAAGGETPAAGGEAETDEAEATDEAADEAAGAAEPAKRVRTGPGQDQDDEALERELAALLFAAAEPLGEGRLVELLERPEPARVRAALDALARRLAEGALPIRLRKYAGGWRLFTDPAVGDVVARLRKEARPERLSSAALETLAIVAYRQPVTKAEIEAIRGVQSGALLRSLVDRGLARVTGRADQPGSPLQYGTTREFLERFGLAGLGDLPRDAELSRD